MNIKSQKDFEEMSMLAQTDSHTFWSKVAEKYLWDVFPKKTLQGSFTDLPVRWFDDGQLNITESCLDRHARSTPNKVAFYFEPNSVDEAQLEFTYKDLLKKVCQFANTLKELNVKKGDVVCFYMPMGPELLMGVLASARIGAVHSVVFGGFSAVALKDRVIDSQAKVIVTSDIAFRGSKTIALKAIVDEAIKDCPFVESVLVHQRSKQSLVLTKKDYDLKIKMQSMSEECPPTYVGAEDPLFILYTSGSTGKPKGLLHTVGGYMVWTGETFKNVFQYQPQDIFWCTADIGWITGHSYIAYGPFLNGATQVVYEGVPNWPDASRLWQIVEKYKVTHFYTAPTAIRALEAEDISFVRKYKMESLKVLGSVGEPINEEAWQWYFSEVGKKKTPIVDTWWQTETGGIMISSIAGITPSVPTVATQPLPGVVPALFSADGKKILQQESEGALCIEKPWPGIARSIYKDHERYVQTYFSTYPGFYFTGDGAKRFANGDYRIIGRIDDVVNVSGHRIGTAEVEDIINLSSAIVESAVIGVPHAIKGQCIVAFVICVEVKTQEFLLQEVNQWIAQKIGPIAKLEKLFIVDGLPKTRSGKIMRRVLRKAYDGDRKGLGDISTLVNPDVVEDIFKKLGF